MAENTDTGNQRTIEQEVELAKSGDRKALESVVRIVQKDIYNLALRFLWHPQDAEDATQEILIRVITGLSGFRGESRFESWVYRVACNSLLTQKKRRMEQQAMNFERFADDLSNGLSDAPFVFEDEIEQKMLVEEVKIGCTLAMLQCLERSYRLAYILGEIMELDHIQAAQALEITPVTYRKRLSRARTSILSFMKSQCGLVKPANACRCHRRLSKAISLGRVVPSQLIFATSYQAAQEFPRVLAVIRQLEVGRRVAALYHSHPEMVVTGDFTDWLKELLNELSDGNPSDSIL